jgi:Trp operon repressor
MSDKLLEQTNKIKQLINKHNTLSRLLTKASRDSAFIKRNQIAYDALQKELSAKHVKSYDP